MFKNTNKIDLKDQLKRIHCLSGFFFIGIIFAALILMVGHGNILYQGADEQFHYNRIYELYRNIQHGNFFPTISTYSANQIGSNVITMYPSLPNYLGAFLLFIFPRVPALYILLWIQWMVQYAVARYVAGQMGLTKSESFTAAVLFTTATPLVTQTIQQWLFGEVWAMSFMPLVLLGMYRIAKKFCFNDADISSKKIDFQIIWPLAIGFGLMLNCHVLSSVIIFVYTAIFALIVFVFGKNRLNFLLQMFIAGGWAFLLSAGFLLPFLYNSAKNKMLTPKAYDYLSTWAAPGFKDMFHSSFCFFANTIGLIAIISLILGALLFFTPKYGKKLKTLYVAAVLLTLAGTRYVWVHIYNSPLGVIQFPHRVFVVAIFVLSILIVLSTRKLFKNKLVEKIVMGLLVIFSVLFMFVGTHNHWLNIMRMTSSNVNYVPSADHKLPTSNSGRTFYTKSNTIDNLTKYWETFGAFDYLPEDSQQTPELLAHQIVMDNQVVKGTSYRSLPNGIEYSGKFGSGQAELPFIYYKGHYRVTDQNGKSLNYYINHKKQFVVSTKADTTKIQVKRGYSFIEIVAYLISILSVIFSAILFIRIKKEHSL